jgi:hypothetical protein
MDPLTALGLAANIIQFVDFGLKVVSGARDLYISTSGTTVADLEAKEVAEHIRRLANLAASPRPLQGKPDEELIPLSKDCGVIANELIKLIDSVQVTETGSRRIWQSVYKAGQRQWKGKEIENLQKRLDRVGNLTGNFLVIHKQNQMMTDLEQIKKDMTSLKSDRTSDFDKILQELKGVFKTVEEDILRREAAGASSNIPSKMNAALPTIFGKWLDLYTDHSMLKQLRFYAIDDRFNEISNPYPNTYAWIFNDGNMEKDPANSSNPNFANWLGSNENMYWIAGRPGSGKSTIMKYISNNPRTIELLQPWANGCKIAIASFFFWNPAKERLQKSKVGLLRSLLYQLLSKSPGRIQSVFSDVWDSVRNGEQGAQTHFNALLEDTSRLQSLLRQVISGFRDDQVKLIFFIDGLDEYEAKPSDIISLVDDLKKYHGPFLKICLASRPWIEFEDAAFGKNNPWKLELHALTENDITSYVNDLLGRNPLYRDLMKHDHRCPDLVLAIVNAARGIFLWVKLVVSSLLEGLKHSDRVVDLLHRLHEIPTDLNEYFERILDSVEDRYHQDSGRFFLVALDSHSQLPLMIYWHIHESDISIPEMSKFSDQAINHDVAVEFVDMETSSYRLEQMRRRLIDRCKHLLEVTTPTMDIMKHSYYGGPVDFLHRTVRDFLQRPEIRERICNWAGDFDADLAICNGVTTQIRLTPLFQNPLIEESWPPQLVDCLLWHAGRTQAKGLSGDPGIKFATEFFKFLKAHALQHKKPIEPYFQGVDISHSDPADSNAPFDRGTVAARLRLMNLFFTDSELSRLSVAHGRAHPAWKRNSSTSIQGIKEQGRLDLEQGKSSQLTGKVTQEGGKSKKPNGALLSKRPEGGLKSTLKKFFRR